MQFAWYALSLTGRGSFFSPPTLAYVLDLYKAPTQSLPVQSALQTLKARSGQRFTGGILTYKLLGVS